MELIVISSENVDWTFDYWKNIGREVPYFFETTKVAFCESLFSDRFYGAPIFNEHHILAAVEEERVKGLIQFGLPCFHFAEGKRIQDPEIGVIRYLYFDQDREDLGKALLQRAMNFFEEKNRRDLYAFYHAMGMSCNGNHGKLHETHGYIADFLLEEGFDIEHENVYYALEMEPQQTEDSGQLIVKTEDPFKEKLQFVREGKTVGVAEMKFIKDVTGMDSRILFLIWITVDPAVKGKGIGTEFMKHIQNHYLEKGYTVMHTDTAYNNTAARKYYQRNGFKDLGIMRSFHKLGNQQDEV